MNVFTLISSITSSFILKIPANLIYFILLLRFYIIRSINMKIIAFLSKFALFIFLIIRTNFGFLILLLLSLRNFLLTASILVCNLCITIVHLRYGYILHATFTEVNNLRVIFNFFSWIWIIIVVTIPLWGLNIVNKVIKSFNYSLFKFSTCSYYLYVVHLLKSLDFWFRHYNHIKS